MKKADLHVHTNFSDGFYSPKEVVLAAEKKGIDFLAITDHDRLDSAKEAYSLSRKLKTRVRVIIGEEVTSRDGEIIGLFLRHEIPPYLSAEKTCQLIKSQNGLVMVPHPFRKFLGTSLNLTTLEKLISQSLVDLVEIANFWDYPGLIKKRKTIFNGRINVPLVANSDSHSVSTLGKFYNLCSAKDAADLKKELELGKTKAIFSIVKISTPLLVTEHILRILRKKLAAFGFGRRKTS